MTYKRPSAECFKLPEVDRTAARRHRRRQPDHRAVPAPRLLRRRSGPDPARRRHHRHRPGDQAGPVRRPEQDGAASHGRDHRAARDPPTVGAGEAGLLICDGVNVTSRAARRSGSDEKVKVSANDTTPGYLIDKLVAGAGVAAVETNDGSNESVTLRAARLDAIRIYTSDDTWHKPANLDFVIVLVIGGGGGGGGCPTTGAGEQAASAGGGGRRLCAQEDRRCLAGLNGDGHEGRRRRRRRGGKRRLGRRHLVLRGALLRDRRGRRRPGPGPRPATSARRARRGRQRTGTERRPAVTAAIGGQCRRPDDLGQGAAPTWGAPGAPARERPGGRARGPAARAPASLASTAAVNGGDGANGIVILWEYLK